VQTTTAVTVGEHVRSRHMKLFLQCVDAQEPHCRDVLLAAMPREDIALIRESPPIAWLPSAINARATEIVWSALDPKVREMFFLRLGVALLDSSLLNVLLASAVRLFGVEPGRILRWTPHAWTQIYRDATKIVICDIAAQSLRMRFDSLPCSLARSVGWMDSVAVSTSALFNMTGRTGTGVVEESDAARCRMVLRFQWEPLGG
jgi:hypothetical protein